MSNPFTMLAPNGARLAKIDHPALPITIPEIVATARACHDLGADGLHLHVRDDNGGHTLDAARYREVLDELAHTVPQMQIQITTESAGIYSVSEQLACLSKLRPEWASIAIREIAREPDLAARFYASCAANGTKVQHIIYDKSDEVLLTDWQETGIVHKSQKSVLLVLGQYGGLQTLRTSDLEKLIETASKGPDWMICAFGPQEHGLLIAAARMGGNVRVGFENSIHQENGTLWQDNQTSIASLVGKLKGGTATLTKTKGQKAC